MPIFSPGVKRLVTCVAVRIEDGELLHFEGVLARDVLDAENVVEVDEAADEGVSLWVRVNGYHVRGVYLLDEVHGVEVDHVWHGHFESFDVSVKRRNYHFFVDSKQNESFI